MYFLLMTESTPRFTPIVCAIAYNSSSTKRDDCEDSSAISESSSSRIDELVSDFVNFYSS